ncbi:glutathione S-transferase family protein [Alcaligenes endophyticus]|uniref:Glutathione S-transferase family protein n=1 Tax=Alcaligenes endophyticus TaxID=1929088 RepID=A0ABT8EN33_9BURK|nr:glutathione S-transferase family protein [Alcaligenes endophyticus]MCX5591400.1 glutathione S-transferase family protein [Alcaligenes endophyticus]MDN4122719.1 glutathione S-transferase family protein [Alcaligenes endophyticus]
MLINDPSAVTGWVLRTSLASPFGRKVRLAAATLELDIRVEVADTTDPDDSLRQQNPLGKVPVLLLGDGRALFDSSVIIDFLNEYDGRSRLIPIGEKRHLVLVQQALADGILDAALLQMYESRFRPVHLHGGQWLEHQRGKVQRALSYFEQHLPQQQQAGPHIGEISLAVALSYLDLRFEGRWRSQFPTLNQWHKEVQTRGWLQE